MDEEALATDCQYFCSMWSTEFYGINDAELLFIDAHLYWFIIDFCRFKCLVHIPLNPATDSERIRPPLEAPRYRQEML